MVAKLGIYVCPVPGCATIGRSATAGCSAHPTRALTREVYVHRPKPQSPSEARLQETFDRVFGGVFGGDKL